MGKTKIIYQFDCDAFNKDDVVHLSKDECQRLCESKKSSVKVFDATNCKNGFQDILNGDSFVDCQLDTCNCWFRVFDE